jgi:L-xylulose reductase
VLRDRGAKITVLDCAKDETIEAVKAEYACEVIFADLMDMPGTIAKVEEAMKSDGEFQLLVNTAGVAKFEPYFETSEAEYDRQYAINVKPGIFITQAVTKALKEKGLKGSVVHVTSQSSTLALKDHLVYSSGKAGLDHVSRIQALELGKYGIRVNCVRPTVVMTPLVAKAWDPNDLEKMKAAIPLGECAEPEDVGNTVAWLLSDDARMITGSAIAVDGGRSMGGFGL